MDVAPTGLGCIECVALADAKETLRCPMTVELSLSPKAENYLRGQAAAQGKDVAACAAELLDRAVSRLTLDKVLAPIRADFEASGLTEEELTDFITQELDDHRATAG